MRGKLTAAFITLLSMFCAIAAQDDLKIEKNKNPRLKLPDLVITVGSYDHVKPRVRVRVENKGAGASKSCTLKLFAIKSKGLVIIEKIEFTRNVPGLASGAFHASTFELPKTENEVTTLPSLLVVDSGNVVLENKESNNEWSFASKPIQASNLSSREGWAVLPEPSRRRGAFLAHARSAPAALTNESVTAFQSQVSCPESVVVGIINPPANWADYSKKKIPFAGVTIKNSDTGSYVTCEYSGDSALDRFVPGRACERVGPKSPALLCRAFPTKK